MPKERACKNLATTESYVLVHQKSQPEFLVCRDHCQLRSAHTNLDLQDNSPYFEANIEKEQISSESLNGRRICDDASVSTGCYENAPRNSNRRMEICAGRKKSRVKFYQQGHTSVLQKKAKHLLNTAELQRNNQNRDDRYLRDQISFFRNSFAAAKRISNESCTDDSYGVDV